MHAVKVEPDKAASGATAPRHRRLEDREVGNIGLAIEGKQPEAISPIHAFATR